MEQLSLQDPLFATYAIEAVSQDIPTTFKIMIVAATCHLDRDAYLDSTSNREV